MHAARSRRATRVSWIRTDLARGLFVMREAISMQLEVHSWIRTDRARGRGMTILHVLDRPRRSGKIRRRSKIRPIGSWEARFVRSKIRRATHSREIARSGAVPRSARFLVILAPRRAQVRALARAHQRCAGSREVYLQSTGPSSAPRRALRALPLRPSKVNESVSPFFETWFEPGRLQFSFRKKVFSDVFIADPTLPFDERIWLHNRAHADERCQIANVRPRS